MPETTPLFIGYKTLEGWIASGDTREPVLAVPLIERGTDQGGIRTDALLVVCQQADDHGSVHYCRLRAASLTRCHGEPFDADWREREAAWHSLWKAVREILERHGFRLREATVAPPQGLRFLEARAEGIAFDPASRRFACVDAEAQGSSEGEMKRCRRSWSNTTRHTGSFRRRPC